MKTRGLYDHMPRMAYRVAFQLVSGVAADSSPSNRQLGLRYIRRAGCQEASARHFGRKERASHLGLHAFEFTNVGSALRSGSGPNYARESAPRFPDISARARVL